MNSKKLSPKSAESVDTGIGKRLRMRRMELKRSQSWLGERVNVTFQQVQKYEKGVNRISATQLQTFARALDVPVDYFYGTAFDSTPESFAGFGESAAAEYDAGGVESDIARVSAAMRQANDPKLSKSLADFVLAALQNKTIF